MEEQRSGVRIRQLVVAIGAGVLMYTALAVLGGFSGWSGSSASAAYEYQYQPCKVTNAGRITAANGDKATFGGNAQVPASGPKGQEQYQDHGPAQPMNAHSINVQAVTCSADKTQASIFGQATINGSGTFDYRIDVKDLSEPGRDDTYRIRLSNGYDSGEQKLVGGNVQIHK